MGDTIWIIIKIFMSALLLLIFMKAIYIHLRKKKFGKPLYQFGYLFNSSIFLMAFFILQLYFAVFMSQQSEDNVFIITYSIIAITIIFYLGIQKRVIWEKGISSVNGAWFKNQIKSFWWEKDYQGRERILKLEVTTWFPMKGYNIETWKIPFKDLHKVLEILKKNFQGNDPNDI